MDGIRWPELPLAAGAEIGSVVDHSAGRNRYMGYLISLGMYSFKGKKVALDCANGSAWSIAPHIFEALGAEVAVINNRPNGLNINDNAGSTHILSLIHISSLEAPGANLTGTSDYLDTNAVMSLILAADPDVQTVGLLYDQGDVYKRQLSGFGGQKQGGLHYGEQRGRGRGLYRRPEMRTFWQGELYLPGPRYTLPLRTEPDSGGERAH